MGRQHQPRSWRLRFTLRLVLAVVTILCIWLAIHTQRARRQQAIVAQLENSLGIVTYDYVHSPTARILGDRSWVPKWLLDCLGRDFFHTVVQVHVRGQVDFEQVSRLQSLHTLIIWKHDLSDEDMQHVARLTGLRKLTIQSDMHASLPGDYPDTTQIGDPSLATIATFPRLEDVYVEGYHFTASGLAALATSRSLRQVDVRCCDASVIAADAEPFRRAARVAKLTVWRWTEEKGEELVSQW